ncbi:alginate O-acetyltransferase AlgX-related protein [Euryhalocaulis caribicus]|uniref:alginate O-acetyltransferase AlgX-related protein n=1 Tax=Euryhalocaulis caribicus TaxID=1161401 RepID=UPI00039EDA40|nr:hypothetical protein [Euryhalocaulis caribicus]
MRRFYRSFLVLFLVLALALLGLGVLFPADTGDLNRRPVPYPDVRADRLFDAGFYADLGEALADRITARAFWRSLDAAIDYEVLRDTPSDRVVVGREDWLYYQPALDIERRPLSDAQETRSAMLSIASAAPTEIDFYFAFAPNKATIYPEYLPRRYRASRAGGDRNIDALRAALADGPGFVDLWSPMREARRQNGPEPLVYFKRDTHWNGYGAAVAAEAIMDAIAPGLWDSSAIQPTDVRTDQQDLDRIAGLWRSFERETHSAVREGVTLETTDMAADMAELVHVWRASGQAGAPVVNQKLVVIHDSFGTALERLLPPYFRDTAFIHIDALASPEAHMAIRDADIVVMLLVERKIYRMRPGSPLPPRRRSRELQSLLESLDTAGAPKRKTGGP